MDHSETNEAQIIRFRLSKTKSTPNAKGVGVDVRLIEILIDDGTTLVFRRKIQSKNKLNAKTIKRIVASLNHMSVWLQKTNKLGWLNTFIHVLVSADRVLDSERIKRECSRTIENSSDEDLLYREVELDYFKKYVMEFIVCNPDLLAMVNEYISAISLYNLDDGTGKSSVKIEKEDVHQYHVLSVFIKLIFILYYRVSGNDVFMGQVKDLVIMIADKVNTYTSHYIFPDSYNYLRRTFMDRMNSFFIESSKTEFRRHVRNLERFGALGMTEELLVDQVTQEILSAFYRLKVIPYDDMDSKNEILFENMEDYDKFGMVAKLSVGYLQSTKKKVVENIVGKFNPPFIVKTHSSKDDGESSETDRFSVFLEKSNKGNYYEYREHKDAILKDINIKTAVKDRVELLQVMTEKHLLNQEMVSMFLRHEYECDVSELLTTEEFLQVLNLVHERINKYPSLKVAIIGRVIKSINKVEILPEELPLTLINGNEYRVIKTLKEIASKEYACVNPIKVEMSKMYTVRDDLIAFFNDGCKFI